MATTPPSVRPTVTVPVEFRLPNSATLNTKFPATPSPSPIFRLALDGTKDMSPDPLAMFPEAATSAAVIVIALFAMLMVDALFWVNVPARSSSESASMVSVPLVVMSAPAPASVTPLCAVRLKSPLASVWPIAAVVLMIPAEVVIVIVPLPLPALPVARAVLMMLLLISILPPDAVMDTSPFDRALTSLLIVNVLVEVNVILLAVVAIPSIPAKLPTVRVPLLARKISPSAVCAARVPALTVTSLFPPEAPMPAPALSATKPVAITISSPATVLVILPEAWTPSVPLSLSVRVPSKSTFPP